MSVSCEGVYLLDNRSSRGFKDETGLLLTSHEVFLASPSVTRRVEIHD